MEKNRRRSGNPAKSSAEKHGVENVETEVSTGKAPWSQKLALIGIFIGSWIAASAISYAFLGDLVTSALIGFPLGFIGLFIFIAIVNHILRKRGYSDTEVDPDEFSERSLFFKIVAAAGVVLMILSVVGTALVSGFNSNLPEESGYEQVQQDQFEEVELPEFTPTYTPSPTATPSIGKSENK